MNNQTTHDQVAKRLIRMVGMVEKIANVDLNKEPANDHEKRLQFLKRFFLEADWLDEN